MKLEINHKKEKWEKMITWRLNNMLLKKKKIYDEIKEEIKNTLRLMTMKI